VRCTILILAAIVVAVAASQVDAKVLHASKMEAKKCDKQHPQECRQAISWYRKIIRESKAAIAWQKHERMKLKHRITSRLSSAADIGNMNNWVCIHQHEGAWNDSGDPYWGGLQMDKSFMAAYGSDMIRKYGGYADRWTPRDQMVVAQRAYRTRGYNPWPNTARMCGLL
jgi:hypothetical protein